MHAWGAESMTSKLAVVACREPETDVHTMHIRGVHRIGLRPFNPTVYKTSWRESDPRHKYSCPIRSDPNTRA